MDKLNSILLRLMEINTSLYEVNKEKYDDCAEMISGFFVQLGFSTELIQTEKGKIVIGKFFKNDLWPHVHFNGHYDIVPNFEKGKVKYDSDKSIFYGRGCSDMKGGIVSIWLACESAIKQKLKVNMSFSFTPDEETGGTIASKRLCSDLLNFIPEETMVIIGDSSYPNIITSHRGALWTNVNISLDSGKRFEPDVQSAFNIMCQFNKEFQLTPNEKVDAVVGGYCESSEAINVWPHTVSFSIDYRFDLPMTIDNMKCWVNDHLIKINSEIKTALKLKSNPLSWQYNLEIDSCVKKSEYTKFLKVVQEVIPDAKEECGKGFYDLRYFRNVGFYNSFVLGPGDIWNAHVKDEMLNKKNLIDCANAYIKLMERMACGDFKWRRNS